MPINDVPQASSIQKISVGGGRIALKRLGNMVAFTELSSTYPLKLLSPQSTEDGVGLVYVLTYGGGLVGGDRVHLMVDVGDNASLVLLTQGSTKVFKTRIGDRLSSLQPQGALPCGSMSTAQIMNISIEPNGALFLLPEPVTCFRSARYDQIQTFRLSRTASAVILDWVTSGRKSLGEEWAFSKYNSINDIWVEGKQVAKDVMLLDENLIDAPPLPSRTLQDKLAPYSCYATVFLFGPLVQIAIKHLSARYQSIVVFKQATPDKLIWSLSLTHYGTDVGAIIRTAGSEPEDVKLWLKDALIDVEGLVGVDTYRRAFN